MAVAEGAAVVEVVEMRVVAVDIMRSSLRSRIRKVSTSSSTSLRSISWFTRDTRNPFHWFILHTIIMIRTMDEAEVEGAEEEEGVEVDTTTMEIKFIMIMMIALRQLL